MLSVSYTTVRPDDDQPGSAIGCTEGSKPVTIGPDYPQRPDPGRRPWPRFRRVAAPFVVLTAVALVLVGVAGVQVAHDRNAVERDLAAARVAAARVSEHLAEPNLQALERDLELLSRSGTAARAGSAGFSWALAGRADFTGGQVRALRRDSLDIAALAAEADPLREALAPLLGPGTASTSVTGREGPSGLYALDDLARGLNRYASAAGRSADPSAPAIARAAVAAGMLPALAGGDGPRTWTVCRLAAGPCVRVKVVNARFSAPVPSAAPGTISPPGRRWAAGVDLLVIGVAPGTLFGRSGTLDPAAIFDLLHHLDTRPAASMRSAVGAEQQAIDLLSRA